MTSPVPPSLTPAQFRALFDEHLSFVWRVLKRHGVPERELEDGCQEVFLVVHKHIGDFEGRSSLRTWIYSIASRVALGMRRKAHVKREQLGEEMPEQSAVATQHDSVERGQSLALIEAALHTLKDEKREAFALYELEGMTLAEVSTSLGVPENTVRYRLHTAREDIQAFIRRQTGETRREAAPLLGRSSV